MIIRDLLRGKAPAVITITPDAPVQEAMRVLTEHNIGAVVVTDGSMLGILSERDVLRGGAERLEALASLRVRDLMTERVITASPDADIASVMDIMTEHRIRHLPVVENGRLCGMISIGDVVNALRQSVEAENRYLHAYISGAPM